jgi:hypothetical protein
MVRNGSERLKKDVFSVRNGSVTPREESFAKQTQVMLFGGWSADDVTAQAYPVSIKLVRYSGVTRGKRCFKFKVEFPTAWMVGGGVQITT